jgi:hypothetical protein
MIEELLTFYRNESRGSSPKIVLLILWTKGFFEAFSATMHAALSKLAVSKVPVD